MSPKTDSYPHRRFNALNGTWLQISPNRAHRPWQGATEREHQNNAEYVSSCYLCPGNQRANGDINPEYKDVYVFNNDFPALLKSTQDNSSTAQAPQHQNLEPNQPDELFQHQTVRGECRVICYSPKHNEHFSSLPIEHITKIVDLWAEQTNELGEKFSCVQIFENRGETMGCSNPHPHGQIWAIDCLPTEIDREHRQQVQYQKTHDNALLTDYATQEIEQHERVVFSNQHWLVCVPYWASWPFETIVLPTFQIARMPDLNPAQRITLANTLKTLCAIYDRVFNTEFPYSMGWHGAPYRQENSREVEQSWQLHGHFYPPLLRSASIKKFMVGYELLAEAQRDITPEIAAKVLRSKYRALSAKS